MTRTRRSEQRPSQPGEPVTARRAGAEPRVTEPLKTVTPRLTRPSWQDEPPVAPIATSAPWLPPRRIPREDSEPQGHGPPRRPRRCAGHRPGRPAKRDADQVTPRLIVGTRSPTTATGAASSKIRTWRPMPAVLAQGPTGRRLLSAAAPRQIGSTRPRSRRRSAPSPVGARTKPVDCRSRGSSLTYVPVASANSSASALCASGKVSRSFPVSSADVCSSSTDSATTRTPARSRDPLAREKAASWPSQYGHQEPR
jgi:hypothetical protein